MNSKTIRVLYPREPPDAFDGCRRFPQLAPTLQCPFPGWTVEVLSSIIEGLRYTIEPVVLNTPSGFTDFGKRLDNGTWTGMMSQLHNGTVHVLCSSFQRTLSREEYFDYSYPLLYFQPQFVAKKVHLSILTDILDNFRPFQAPVWASLCGVLVVFMFLFPALTYCEYRMGRRPRKGTLKMAWSTLAAQLQNPPESMYFTTFGGKLALLTFSLLSTGVLMWAYEGFVIFSMLGPPKPFPFTETDIINRLSDKSITLMTKGGGSWFESLIKETSGSFFDQVRRTLIKNPLVFANSTEVLRLISTGRYIYLTSEDDVAFMKVKQLCDVVTNPVGLNQVTAHLLFQKGSPLTALFNKEIIRQQSFIRRTHRKYFDSGFRLEKARKCVGAVEAVNPFERAMSIYDFLGILYLLGSGLSFGLFAFIIESIFARLFRKMEPLDL